ncbi:WD40/YVTN/BNR-like repeat-containing protein [Kutzneria chonburiensis]|uniref:WD40/YVTN/BNR-like repeat-containing protein n=1 Tax=Kutzneria chonburiensis TaxID=1483604 RepID=A0ABV6N3Z2_9PSEU|nr:hypothetical protein [Kutzneria chonburiensis]
MRGRNSVVVLLALALAGCGGPDQSTAPAMPPGSFVQHSNAVQAARVDNTISAAPGIRTLVPVGKCAIGIGTYASGNGTVGTHWNGSPDCTSFTLPSNAQHAGMKASSAVALADGSVVGAYSVLQRLGPDGVVTSLADLGDVSATAIVRAGNRLVIGGARLVDGKTSPLLWTSSDDGKTASPVSFPPVSGYVGAMAAGGDTVVAVEQQADDAGLGIWRSVDDGQHWQLTEFTAGPKTAMTTKLVRTGHGWLLVGSSQDDPAHSFLATSSDGVAWKMIDTAKLGEGHVWDATTVKDDDVVLVGETLSPDGRSYCGVAWTGTVDALRRVDLGCDDVPHAVATLADGRVIVVGPKDVWVRA